MAAMVEILGMEVTLANAKPLTHPEHLSPFALSLLKPVLSDAAGGVEGGRSSLLPEGAEERCFDKLSTNGQGACLPEREGLA